MAALFQLSPPTRGQCVTFPSIAFMRFLRKLHKWLGLIVGIQMVLWTVSGLMFALLDHHEVTPEHHAPPTPALASGATIAEPAQWLDAYAGKELYDIRLAPLLDQWVWRVETSDGIELRRAVDGQRLEIDAPIVERLATSHYHGEGKLEGVTFHAASSMEARDAGAVWAARFNDARNTTVYFAANDGGWVATRNATWRVFDFFWMLHPMDYKGRDDFNNPLVITVATATLWLSISGVILLTRSFRPRPVTASKLSQARQES